MWWRWGRVVRFLRLYGVGLKLSDCGGGQWARCERKKRSIWWRWRHILGDLGAAQLRGRAVVGVCSGRYRTNISISQDVNIELL